MRREFENEYVLGGIILTVVFIIVIIAIGILWIFPKFMKQRIYKKMTDALSHKEYDTLDEILDSFWCTFSYKPYNREFMRLTSYTMQGDRKKIEEQYATMFQKLRMSKKQKLPLAKHAFYFYLETSQFEKAHEILSVCKDDPNTNEYHVMQIMYDILADKKSNHIQEIKKSLDQLKSQKDAYKKEANRVRIGAYEYLLGLQYHYLHNVKTSQSYLKAALKNCRHTPYEPLIQEMLQS